MAGVDITKVSTALNFSDLLGSAMVRWGINRNSYKVSPGLYAIGDPENNSDVFVTANYKLSFDTLRRNLSGINGWILVLDTKGINVWCAAGKGTFGTDELINRIRSVSLDRVVKHRKIILPQLGATGVAAHKIKEETGFNVHYGPVRASDIKSFIAAGYRADKEMRRVRFGLFERAKLIPVELVGGMKYLLTGLAIISLLSLIGLKVFSFQSAWGRIAPAGLNLIFGYASGVVLTPLLLPVLPGRSFAMKGAIAGLSVTAILILSSAKGREIFEILAWSSIIISVSSFLGMNFTGSSTYTSLSGVRKEMRIAVPIQITVFAAGLILFIIAKIFN